MLKFENIAQITLEAVKEQQQEDTAEENRPRSRKELRNAEVKEHLQDLIDTTSFHGICYIFDQRHPIRRVIWFFITVAAFIYSMSKVYESTVNHFSYPFNTARMRHYVNELEFPAVSFCNTNDMRMSVVNGTMLDRAILNRSLAKDVTENEYKVAREAAHEIEEMIVDCSFNGKECYAGNFSSFYWKEYRCFTFNSGKDGHPILNVSGPGKDRSLKLTINIQHYDYFRLSPIAGVHLILHGQQETPVRMRGEMLPPGFSSYIQIEKKKIINLEPPFKTRCGSLKLKYSKGYSMHNCWLEQLTDYVIQHCNCTDYFMPGNFRVCSTSESLTCMWPKWEFDQNKLYNCPLPCEIDSYKTEMLSRALFPSYSYSKVLARKLQNLTHMQNVTIEDETLFMRNNLLRIFVYYDNMSYERLEQIPSYDTLVWLGDVGGTLGLFIGAGAMSYFEVIDCIALVVYARFFQKFQTQNYSDSPS